MGDIFVEELVKAKTGMMGYLARIAGVLLVLLSFSTFVVLGFYCLIVVFFAGYLEYKIWQWTSVEYEYAFLSGELDVDRILGQNSRKRFFSINFEDVEVAAYENDERVRPYLNPDVEVVDLSSGTGEVCLVLCGTVEGRRTRVMLEPGEKMVKAMENYAPKKVFLQ